MLKTVSVLAIAGALVAVAGAAPAAAGSGSFAGSDTTDANAGGGSISVQITSTGTTTGGHTFTTSIPGGVTVQAKCWLTAGMTGQEFYDFWKPGGPARQAGTTDAYAAQGLLPKDFEDYKDDPDGHWYGPMCAIDAPADYVREYQLAHLPDTYVKANEQPPAAAATVDPEVLAQAASDAMKELLPPGKLEWNPKLSGTGATIVGTKTWVWLDDASSKLSVTASIPSGVWARVDANLAGMDVSAAGAAGASCPDAGTPYAAGASTTSCAITFQRSTANQAVGPGDSAPTTTMTATARWTSSWVSSLDANPTALPTQTIATDAQIAVAEIESVVNS